MQNSLSSLLSAAASQQQDQDSKEEQIRLEQDKQRRVATLEKIIAPFLQQDKQADYELLACIQHHEAINPSGGSFSMSGHYAIAKRLQYDLANDTTLAKQEYCNLVNHMKEHGLSVENRIITTYAHPLLAHAPSNTPISFKAKKFANQALASTIKQLQERKPCNFEELISNNLQHKIDNF